MKRVSIYILIAVTIIVAIYFAVTRNGLPIINISNVKSVTIGSGLVPIKQLNIENNKAEIENLISMYNKAKRSY